MNNSDNNQNFWKIRAANKEVYNMRTKGGDCIVRTKNVILVGEKNAK